MIENSYSVLIVDDELPIREELRMNNWESFGTTLIGEAENGEEALEICQKYKPDIIITDIYMPKMDGLELIKQLKIKFPYSQVIILTTYSEFNLVQEALKLGAVDYLLKVVMDDNELEKALEKAKSAVEREISYMEKKKKRKAGMIFTKLKTKNVEINNNVILGNISYPIYLIKYQLPSIVGMENIIESKINKVFYHFEKHYSSKIEWLPVNNLEQILIVNKSENDHLIQLITELNQNIKNIFDNEFYYLETEVQFFAIIGNDINTYKELESVYRRMKQKFHFYFYESNKNIFLLSEFPVGSSIEPEELEKIKKIKKDYEISLSYLQIFINDVFYDWANTIRPRPDEIKELALKWIIDWINKFNISEERRESVQKIWKATTMDELIGIMIYITNQGKLITSKRMEVMQAKSLIEECISAPLSLTYIADHVNLSPHYFSRLFREEVGESFNEYLTRRRIERAIEMLQTENLKVYEVANKVGIPSYRYFSVVFKKKTGKTPLEYRRGLK